MVGLIAGTAAISDNLPSWRLGYSEVTPSLLIMTGLNCSQLEYPMKCHTKTASTVNLTNLYLSVEIVEAETNILQSNISIFLSLAGKKGYSLQILSWEIF